MEFGWLFIIIFSVLIILDIIHLVNLVSSRKKKGTYGESPLHILKRRYANLCVKRAPDNLRKYPSGKELNQ